MDQFQRIAVFTFTVKQQKNSPICRISLFIAWPSHIYAINQPFHQDQDVTQDQILSGVMIDFFFS